MASRPPTTKKLKGNAPAQESKKWLETICAIVDEENCQIIEDFGLGK